MHEDEPRAHRQGTPPVDVAPGVSIAARTRCPVWAHSRAHERFRVVSFDDCSRSETVTREANAPSSSCVARASAAKIGESIQTKSLMDAADEVRKGTSIYFAVETALVTSVWSRWHQRTRTDMTSFARTGKLARVRAHGAAHGSNS